MARKDWVTASDIGSYAYCPRRFWLQSVKRVRTGDGRVLAAGVRNHHRHGVRYDWQLRLRRAARWVLAASVLIAAIALAAAMGVL